MAEQRQSARKILKVKAMVVMDGQAPVLVRTADVGTQGVSITMPYPMGAGQSGQLRFDLLVEGCLVPVQSRVKVAYCILSNGEFKVGFHFQNLDAKAMIELARYVR